MPGEPKHKQPSADNNKNLEKMEEQVRIEQEIRVGEVKLEANRNGQGETSKKGVNPDG